MSLRGVLTARHVNCFCRQMALPLQLDHSTTQCSSHEVVQSVSRHVPCRHFCDKDGDRNPERERERGYIPDATLSPPVMRVDKQCEVGVGKSRPTQCSSALAHTSHTVHCSFSRSDGGHARGTNDHQWNVSLVDALGGLCGEDLGSHL